jgi:type IV pilus assembly protein PilW
MMIKNQLVSKKIKKLSHQSGFNLIELMIALLISLLILVALGTLFLNVTRSSSEMAKTNLQIENGRYAMQLLQDDIVHAGFWGGYIPNFDDLTALSIPGDVPTAVPNLCLAYNATNWNATYKQNLLGIPVQAYTAVPASCATQLSSKKANTDILAVRYAENCITGISGCEPDVAGRLYFQVSNCQPPRPDITTPESAYVLDTTGFTSLHQRNCTAVVTDKRRFISNIYYIRNFANTAGDGIPTLMKSTFDLSAGSLAHQPAEPLIEGIEGFHVELGVDNLSDSGAAVNYGAAVSWLSTTNLTSPTNRGDGVPDGAFVNCTSSAPCNVAQLMNTVAVKIYVLARNLETTQGYTDTKTYRLGSVTLGPFNDQYKRHVFQTTVRLNNISARRETP